MLLVAALPRVVATVDRAKLLSPVELCREVLHWAGSPASPYQAALVKTTSRGSAWIPRTRPSRLYSCPLGFRLNRLDIRTLEVRNVRNTPTADSSNRTRPLAVKVWGDFACFTRPDMKVERVSYPVMTPSAARGILESIFWQPEFRWKVEEIVVLRPIRYFSILRNEVRSKAVFQTAAGWMESGRGQYISNEDRTQRHTLALRDVAYIVSAHVVVRQGVGANSARYRDQFRRRVKRGSYFAAPYLGCREFAASFGPVDGSEQPAEVTADLGRMLLDLQYDSADSSGPIPRFFDARLERGTMRVPDVPLPG